MTKDKILPVVLLCILLISAGCIDQDTSLETLNNTTDNSKDSVKIEIYNDTAENLGYKNYIDNSSALKNQSFFSIGIYEKNISTTTDLSEYSIRDIVFHYNLTISKYTNKSELARNDPALTEDSIDRLTNNSEDIKLIDVVEGSSVKLIDVVSKNKLINDINKSSNADIGFSVYTYTKSDKIEIFNSDYTFTDGLNSNPGLSPYFNSQKLNINKDQKLSEGSYKINKKTHNYTVYSIYVYNNSSSKRARLIDSKIEYDDFTIQKTGIYPISNQREQDNIIRMMRETKKVD